MSGLVGDTQTNQASYSGLFREITCNTDFGSGSFQNHKSWAQLPCLYVTVLCWALVSPVSWSTEGSGRGLAVERFLPDVGTDGGLA